MYLQWREKMRFRTTMMIAIVLVLAAGVQGQELEKKVSIAYSLTPSPQVTVRNNHSARLTGMVIVVSSTVPPYRRAETIWLDPAINFRQDRALETGASASFSVGPLELAPQLKPQLMAAEFEDGTSGGDAQW